MRKHGHWNTPTWRSWESMKGRCTRPSMENYERYGARGVAVCERWQSFENFLADMGVRPTGTTLDRIDSSKAYAPGNCRWATPKEQARNRRSNVLITYNGATKTIAAWAEEVGLDRATLGRRIQKGWTPERALNPADGRVEQRSERRAK